MLQIMASHPRTVSVTDLKAHALALVARVDKTGEPTVITKRGRPVARLVPYRPKGAAVPGGLRHTLRGRLGDLVSPLEADWEASR
jgi:prevent-host-death family protein